MADIFVSYASEDRERIRPLVSAFEDRGWSVWWDRHLEPGASFDDAIDEALGDSGCVVVVWTEKSVTSDWVRTEALEAQALDLLVPVLLDDVRIPLAFRRTQAARLDDPPFVDETDAEFSRLLKAIAGKVGESGTVTVSPTADARESVEPPSVLVLPFISMSEDKDYEYLADGMTEETITLLTQWTDFFVIAMNTSFSFKGQSIDVRDTGRALGVRYVVEGSLRKVGDRIRVTVQLVQTDTGAQVWAERYDRPLSTIFELQDEVSIGVAAALGAEILASEVTRVSRFKPGELDAWGLYLQARASLVNISRESNDRAMDLLERALALDPDFARAHALLAVTIGYRVTTGLTRDHDADLEAGRRAWETALSNAPNDTPTLMHCTRAAASLGLRRRGLEVSERVLRLGLHDAYRGALLNSLGRAEEGMEAITNAIKQSPRDFNMGSFLTIQATSAMLLGDYDAVAEHAGRAVEYQPENYQARLMVANAYAATGRIPEAQEIFDQVTRMVPGIRTETLARGWSDWFEEEATAVRMYDALAREGIAP